MTGPCLTGLDMDTRLYSRYISLLLEERKQLQDDGQSRCLYKYNHHGARGSDGTKKKAFTIFGIGIFSVFSNVSRLYEDLGKKKNREEG